VTVRHEGRQRTALTLRAGAPVSWKAVFDGARPALEVDGVPRTASTGADEAGRPISWVTVEISAGRAVSVSVPAAR
jgi:hypothetical protein